MKFKFSKVETAQQRISIQSARRNKLKFDTKLAESWNDLRIIGSNDAYKRLTDATHDPNESIRDLESHDWDLYITKYNEQYKKQLRAKEKDQDVDSISTIAETMSKLLTSRKQRLMLYHKLFLATCMLLWLSYAYLIHVWYVYFIVNPVGFLDFEDAGIFTQMYTPQRQFFVFILYHHTWIIGSFGVLAATCFRDNPAVIRKFILLVPYALIIPIGMIFGGVQFSGALNAQKLKASMEKSLSDYYGTSNTTNDTQWQWDQIHRMLSCCGYSGSSDWYSVDENPNEFTSPIPVTCCPKKFFRDKWVGEPPPRDDCYNKINRMHNTDEYEWAYPNGCGEKALEFFVKLGASAVGAMFIILLILCLCLVFGKQYYTLKMKNLDLSFKYYFRDWLAEILFLRTLGSIRYYVCKTFFSNVEMFERFQYENEDPRSRRKKMRSEARRQQSLGDLSLGDLSLGEMEEMGQGGGGRASGVRSSTSARASGVRSSTSASATASSRRGLSAPVRADPNLPDYSKKKEDEEQGVKFKLSTKRRSNSITKTNATSSTSIQTILRPKDNVKDDKKMED